MAGDDFVVGAGVVVLTGGSVEVVDGCAATAGSPALPAVEVDAVVTVCTAAAVWLGVEFVVAFAVVLGVPVLGVPEVFALDVPATGALAFCPVVWVALPVPALRFEVAAFPAG